MKLFTPLQARDSATIESTIVISPAVALPSVVKMLTLVQTAQLRDR